MKGISCLPDHLLDKPNELSLYLTGSSLTDDAVMEEKLTQLRAIPGVKSAVRREKDCIVVEKEASFLLIYPLIMRVFHSPLPN